MLINWKRGLFRLWLVSSVIWVLAVFTLSLFQAMELAELTARGKCDALLENGQSSEWHECFRKAQLPEGGGTWLGYYMRHNWLFFSAGPPLIALLIAITAGLWKVIGWIARGFKQDSN